MRTSGPELCRILLALSAIAALVRPWGDYPVNDDWQYARIVKRLAETGRFLVDVEIAPSLVGQAWVAAAVVNVFGFSHVVLRVVTVLAAALLLWIVDRILALVSATRTIRVLTVALLLANPLVLHLAFSFMTEMYGYALALLRALAWLRGRARRPETEPAAISWLDGLTAATLVGASFWIRQLCVAVFPALIAASLLTLLFRRDRRALAASLPVLVGATAWLGTVVSIYFVWAKASGNYVNAFDQPIRSLLHIDTALIIVSMFEAAAYLTMFLFPFRLLERWRTTRWRRFILAASAAAAVVVIARGLQPYHAAFHHHVRFPFSANVVHDTGVGPITFTATYWQADAQRPRWPAGIWTAIEWMLLGGMLMWSRVVADRPSGAGTPPLTAEVRNFGLLLAGFGFVLSVQAYQWQVLDRYYLPCVLGALIALGARAARSPAPARPWLPLAAVLPLARLSIAGVHDTSAGTTRAGWRSRWRRPTAAAPRSSMAGSR